MATAKDVLAIAAGEIGTKESPASSNRVKYARWYGLNGQPWCVMFVDWCFQQADARELLPIVTASCTELMNAAKRKNCWVTKDYRPGDIPIYNFFGKYHTGIIEAVGGADVVSVEGNTAPDNDSNGGAVMRRTRPISKIMGAVRPKYEEDDMDISKLTDQEVLQLAERMQKLLGKRSVSAGLAGELREAKDQGITDGSQPNAFCTRAQAAIMAKRAAER